MQLLIADEVLAELHACERRRGWLCCAEAPAGTLLALSRDASRDVVRLYPRLRLARDPLRLRRLPFVKATIPDASPPWVLQPAGALFDLDPRTRLRRKLAGLPHLPRDYQPYQAALLERARSGLLVVDEQQVALIRARACHGVPSEVWGPLPVTTVPVSVPCEGESPLIVGKRLVLVGAGSLGSRAAELLAAAGAAEIVLVDHDVLKARNLRRHLCGVEQLGRPKVEAVADTLAERGFPTSIVPVQARAHVEGADRVRAEIARSDLVLCTTDSAPPRQFANHAALHAGVPSVIADVQLRPEPVAEIVVTVPGGGGCWNCWRTELERGGVMMPPARHDPADYPAAEDPVPSGLPMYQLTVVAATACDLAGVALARDPRSLKWLMALDTDSDFPNLPSARHSTLEGLERHPTCEVCAR